MSGHRIVVLDGHALNPGDLSWDGLREFWRRHGFSPHRASGSHRASSQRLDCAYEQDTVDRRSFHQSRRPSLRRCTCDRLQHCCVSAARAREIVVTNVPVYGTQSVAQHVFALLLELTQRVGRHSDAVHEGRWGRSSDWCFWDGGLVELTGLTLGVVGMGRIGNAVGQLGEAFGMKVRFATHAGGRKELEDIFRASDVVSLHCPLTAETRELINPATLAWLKPTAFLINTSRGGLVDEAALAQALNKDRLAGAGLDVLSIETSCGKPAHFRPQLHHHAPHRVGHHECARPAHDVGTRKPARVPLRSATKCGELKHEFNRS